MVLAITDQDKETLKSLCGNSIRIETSPSYIETNSDFRCQVENDNLNKQLLFLGTMSWFPNEDGIIWFYQNVFLKLKAHHPDVRLDIVGSNPRKNVLNLGRDQFVTVTGYVENINPYLKRAMLSVVPIRIGGGMRIKILQLLASGIPIVTTSIGCEGIPVTSNKEVLIADSDHDFLFAIKRLLNDFNLRKELSFNSIEFIRNNYSIDCAVEKYERIFNV
jgi:glycosyltransferase involved in cell wall biosynthesis